MKSNRSAVDAYVTKDRSVIRELMHPSVQGNRAQSLAEATLPPGAVTLLHRHAITEEIYHFISGEGWMTLGNERFAVRAGDTVCISPGLAHRLENPGGADLVLLCSCSPAYNHDDTELLSEDAQ